MSAVRGANLIAGQERTAGAAVVIGVDPRTGDELVPAVHEATPADVADACREAASAAAAMAMLSPQERARVLRHVADAVEAAGPEIVAQADAETALGLPRLEGELARTTGQLRFMAVVVEDGSWLEATIDHGPPDLRRAMVALGPAAIVVRYSGMEDLESALAVIGGSLAGAIHGTPGEGELVARLAAVLSPRVGRLIWDGWPTGVAVTWAMHHGGPRPATSDPAHTSVGAAAVRRFLRPVCFQAVPDWLLPPALQDANPLGIPRRVDGDLRLPPAGGRRDTRENRA